MLFKKEAKMIIMYEVILLEGCTRESIYEKFFFIIFSCKIHIQKRQNMMFVVKSETACAKICKLSFKKL